MVRHYDEVTEPVAHAVEMMQAFGNDPSEIGSPEQAAAVTGIETRFPQPIEFLVELGFIRR